MNFFVDNCLPRSLARAIHALDSEHSVEHLKDLFPDPGVPDEVWLPELSKKGSYVIITRDLFVKTPQERKAFQDANLTTFALAEGWRHLKYWTLAQKFLRVWPEIPTVAGRVENGTCLKIPIRSLKFKAFKLSS